MILADKIIDLRKRNGWSQEDLADKLGVSRQSVSKWEVAQSTPDMNKIIMMSEIFGVSTDYLLKDSFDEPERIEEVDDMPTFRTVSMKEASDFMALKEVTAQRIALGVFLCVISPILLIIMAYNQEAGKIALLESQAAGIGVMVLLILVGIGVGLFLSSGFKEKPYEYIEKEAIDTQYGVDGLVKDRREKYRNSYTWHMIVGILLCVLSAIPIFLTMFLYKNSDPYIIYAVSVLLLFIATGVFLIVKASIIWESYHMILQEGEYTVSRKLESKRNENLAAIYWGLVLAAYLLYSFLTNRWDKSWVIWPIAGVLYGVLESLLRITRKK